VNVVMTLLVRDEADIVEVNLAYHLAHGVDEVIVTDHRFTEGTRERLQAWAEGDPRVHLLLEDREACDQSTYVTRMARGGWVFNNDADEFLWPRPAATSATRLPACRAGAAASSCRAALAQCPAWCAKRSWRSWACTPWIPRCSRIGQSDG
jgi:hypothetical protein